MRKRASAPPPSLDSWDEAVEDFLREKRRANLSQATIDLYAMCLRGPRIVVWRRQLGITATSDLTADVVRGLELDLARDLSPATVRIYHRTLKTFARWCDEEGYDLGARVLKLRAPRVPDKEPDTFTHDEERRLLTAVRHPRDRFLLKFMLHTGLRRAEVCAVTTDDVMHGPEGSWLRVRQGKGRKDRVVPLDTPEFRLSRKLAAYIRDVRPRDTRGRELFLSLRRDARGDYTPLTDESLKTILRRLGDETGIRVHAHKFRHTFAARALAAGVDVLALQRVMGHTTLAMTARYAHYSPTSLIDAWAARRD